MGTGGSGLRIHGRSLALAGVVLAHGAVLAILILAPRSPTHGPDIKESPLQWVLIRTAEPAPVRSVRHSNPSPMRVAPGFGQPDRPVPPTDEARPQGRIDWHAEAASTAIHETEREVAEERSRNVFNHATSPAFHDREKAPEFHWDYAATHRVETSQEGGYLIHLNDQCVLVIAVMFMPACTLEKPAARGDLFEHMKDPPKPGEWRDK